MQVKHRFNGVNIILGVNSKMSQCVIVAFLSSLMIVKIFKNAPSMLPPSAAFAYCEVKES